MNEVIFDIKELQSDYLRSTDDISDVLHSTISIFFIVFFSFELSYELVGRIWLLGFKTLSLSIVFITGAWIWCEIDSFLALTLFWGLLLFGQIIFENAAFLNPLNCYTIGVFWFLGGFFSTWLWLELKLIVLTGFFSAVKTLIQLSRIDCLLWLKEAFLGFS